MRKPQFNICYSEMWPMSLQDQSIDMGLELKLLYRLFS